MERGTAVFVDSVGWIALVHRGDEGIARALTSDHHFKQAGFEKLM